MPTKVKIPKRVAGVKIPKKVRKRAKQTLKMAESESMRDLASSAIRAARAVRRASKGSRIKIDGETLTAAAGLQIDADQLGDAIRTAAIVGLRSFLEGLEDGLGEHGVTIDIKAREAPANDEDADKARKPRSRPA